MKTVKSKILINKLGVSASTITIPLGSKFFPVDNTEEIEKVFVEKEKEKSINPIVDNKKIIFRPTDNQWNIIDEFKINLNFFVSKTPPQYHNHTNGSNGPGVYSDIGFIYDDLFCRTNKFINSFVRLLFYDNPNSGDNKLLFSSDIYTQIGGDQKDENGLPKPADESPITFTTTDPLFHPEESHEGYQIYWYKDLVDNAPNQEYELYMSLIFNNAATGKSTLMSPSKTLNPSSVQIGDLNGEEGKLYLKVILKNDNGIYKYKFTPNDKQKSSNGNGGVNLNPTVPGPSFLTFWQINV